VSGQPLGTNGPFRTESLPYPIVAVIEGRTVETDRRDRPGRPNDQTQCEKEVSTRCFMVNECVILCRKRSAERADTRLLVFVRLLLSQGQHARGQVRQTEQEPWQEWSIQNEMGWRRDGLLPCLRQATPWYVANLGEKS
jgi:hypothetical protein